MAGSCDVIPVDVWTYMFIMDQRIDTTKGQSLGLLKGINMIKWGDIQKQKQPKAQLSVSGSPQPAVNLVFTV